MRVLVTGASGFVGKNLTRYLEARGISCIRTDLKGSELDGDLLDESFVFGRLSEEDFDAVIHLAALTRISNGLEKPHNMFKVNVNSTLNLLELASRKHAKFILSSSANIYGVPEKLPVLETHPVRPRLPYDYSKYMSELLVQAYYVAKGLRYTILRTWKLFGENDVPTSAVMRFIHAALSSQSLLLYNGGRDATDFVHIENFCRIVELVLTKKEAEGEIFNVGTGKLLQVRELAKKIIELTGSNSKLEDRPPRTPQEAVPLISNPSIEKAKRLLGYEVAVDLVEGLHRTIDWIRRTNP